METETLTIQEIGKAAERALEYQRYIFRRTYGVYYLVWGAAMVLLLSTDLSAAIGLTGNLASGVEVALSLVVIIAAFFATALIFRGALRTLGLRRALSSERRGYAHYFVAWIVGIYVVIAAADLLAPAYSYAVFDALLLPVPFVLYFMQGLAFPDGRPTEGLIALTTYGGAAAINLTLSLIGLDSWVLGWVWAGTATVWFLAAFYALFRAPEELEALRG